MRSRLMAGLALAVFLAICGGCGYCVHLRTEIGKRDAKIGALLLEAEGAQAALVLKPKEVIKIVEKEIPKEIIKVIKETKADPIVAAKAEATSDPIFLPKSRIDFGVPEVEEEKAPPRPFYFGVNMSLLVVGLDGEEVKWAGSLKARIFQKDPDWSMEIPFAPENVAVTVGLAQPVQDAIREYNRPWIKKHTSLNCPGVGVGLSLDGEMRVTTFVGCTYGISWF